MTFDLRSDWLAEGYGEEETAEFDAEITISAIEAALRELGHEPVRVGNHRALVAALVRGERWDLVFNICEGLHGFGREALVPALLDAWRIPYTFADPLCATLTLHKGVAKRVLRDSGVPTTSFAVVERVEDCDQVDLPYPLFVKPVAEGTGKGVHASSKVNDLAALRERCAWSIATFRQPALVEPFLPGREFTTSIVGEGERARALGSLEIILNDQAVGEAYTFDNKEQWEERVSLRLAEGALAERCAEVALAAWKALGCRDGGRVDLRADSEGRLMVMEANPLPGLNPVHSDLPLTCGMLDVSYTDLIGYIVESALIRAGL
jgi:D-alanine-D-alanine ligase